MTAPILTYEQVLLQLKQQQYRQVYFLFGDEPYYIDKVSDYIEANVLDEGAKVFDQVVLYGRDFADKSIAPAIMQAKGFAMMGGYKVVIVKEAQVLTKWSALTQYLENPQPQTILVICHKSTLTLSRSKDEKQMMKCLPLAVASSSHASVMQSEPLRDYQVPAWITRYIEQWNREQQHVEAADRVTIDPKVTQILADNLGTDLTKIVGALQKLVNGRPEGVHVIDAALVERNIGISKDFNGFELQEALIEGDVVKANRIVRYFATSKDHPIQKELPLLFNFFANLMLYHYLPNKGDEKAVAAALHINPFIVRNYTRAAKRYSAGKTFRIISYFRQTDARSKGIGTGSASELDLWKELLYKILH